MNEVLQIDRLSRSELASIVESAVERAVSPVQRELELWRQHAIRMKTVISASDAAVLSAVKRETVIDEWIKHWGLPAFKRGQQWNMYFVDLMAWRIGEVGFSIRSPHITIVEPQHLARKHAGHRSISTALATRISAN